MFREHRINIVELETLINSSIPEKERWTFNANLHTIKQGRDKNPESFDKSIQNLIDFASYQGKEVEKKFRKILTGE